MPPEPPASSSFAIEVPSALLVRARAGERAALEQVYRWFERPVFTLALRICGDREEAAHHERHLHGHGAHLGEDEEREVDHHADDDRVGHGADPDAGDYQENWFGIVSTADLNRPIFRAHIYQMLVILETSLGQLIMNEFGDDWGAIRLLSEGTQARIKDFYDEERAEGVDLSPITNATLSDLFHIATESNNVWKLMEFDNPNELRPIAYRVNGLRNTIMHPVRPLIVNERELKDLVSAVDEVEKMTDRLMKRIGLATG